MFSWATEATRIPFVVDRFELRNTDALYSNRPEFGFGGFGEMVYYRTYSRLIDGKQERWADTVLRVINGVFSIRQDWYRRRGIKWDGGRWQDIAQRMASAMFRMHWLAPGRGLYAMGTEHVFKVGAMPLFNCGACTTQSDRYAEDLAWIMDALMCGVGVGAEIIQDPVALVHPGSALTCVVEDSRQGWVASMEALVHAFMRGWPLPAFDYSGIRPAGTVLRGIGGVASGPEPLRILHLRMQETFERALRREITPLRMRADHVNQIGACVTMGDVRRSAEMLIGPAGDDEFLKLKDYATRPDRAAWGWASNNTIAIDSPRDVASAAESIASMESGERPGTLNRMLLAACGDRATLVNPCGEIPLEPYELCNVVEVIPARCGSDAEEADARLFATLYSQTVALLPTHQSRTNEVLVRNRRVGVSLTGISKDFDTMPRSMFTRRLQQGWSEVKGHNERFAIEACVSPSIFVTTNKPSGTVSQLAGVTSGMHWRTDEFAIRRVRVGQHSPIRKALDRSGFVSERDPDSGAHVYAFPIYTEGLRNERAVSLAEQFELLETLQKHWADNSVSCTLKHARSMSAEDLEEFLLDAIPKVKCLSILSHEDQAKAYVLPPYEPITAERYAEMVAQQPIMTWASYRGDGEDAQFCDSKSCDLRSLGAGEAGRGVAESDEGLDPVQGGDA